jgi:hypothetical protein
MIKVAWDRVTRNNVSAGGPLIRSTFWVPHSSQSYRDEWGMLPPMPRGHPHYNRCEVNHD